MSRGCSSPSLLVNGSKYVPACNQTLLKMIPSTELRFITVYSWEHRIWMGPLQCLMTMKGTKKKNKTCRKMPKPTVRYKSFTLTQSPIFAQFVSAPSGWFRRVQPARILLYQTSFVLLHSRPKQNLQRCSPNAHDDQTVEYFWIIYYIYYSLYN